jgi:predicted dehydrogenase
MSAPLAPLATVNKIRVGLIGAGNWANHGHLRVLDLLPDYEVVAVQARRREAADAAAQRYHIATVVDTVEEMVALPDVDLVIVLNTAPQHADTVRAVIAAGKDVYCEWPLTVSTEIAEELVQLAAEAGVRHVVGLQRRLAPHNRFVRDLIADNYVGRVRSVRMHVSMNYFQATLPKALAWTIPPENFSSVVAIYAGHFLDMLFYGTRKPISISAILANQFKAVTVRETNEALSTTSPNQLVLMGDLGDDAVLSVHIEGGKRNGSGVQIDITGTEGDLRITNVSAFGDVGDDYVVEGAHGDNLPLARLKIPAAYDWLPESGLPSAVLELANLYVAFAHGANGADAAPDFNDALWMHRLMDGFATTSDTGVRAVLSL